MDERGKTGDAVGWTIGIAGALVLAGAVVYLLLPHLVTTSCIAEGTEVDSPSGAVKIEALEPGQEVSTLDPAGERRPGRVLAKHAAEAPGCLEIELEDGVTLRATPLHPLGTARGWVEAGQVRAGDVLRCREGMRTVAAIHDRPGRVRVFDLEVEPNPNFFAAGVLVHNKSVNWRNAAASLKTLSVAQVDFRSNDRDENGVNDFWVADVSGLYCIHTKDGEALKLLEVSVATADAEPRPKTGGTSYLPLDPFQPKAAYAYKALLYYHDEFGGKIPYHLGNGRNNSKFGFVAFPPSYGKHCMWTMIVDEGNTIFKKDLKGRTIDTFPRDPLADGWERID